MKKVLISAMLLCTYVVMEAQQYSFKSFGGNEGLEHPFIQSIAEDSIGYMWIGTTEGLYRYDGLHFDAFNQDVSDSLSISDNHISTLYVDPDQSCLWVGTNFGGISRLDLNKYEFEQIQRQKDSLFKNGIGVVNTILRLDACLFIGTKENGLQIYDTIEKQFIDIPMDGFSGAYSVSDLVYHKGVIIAATNRGVYEYAHSQIDKGQYQLKKAPYCHSSERVNSLTVENDSTLLICYAKQLVRHGINNQREEVLSTGFVEEAILTRHTVDVKGNIWLGTYGDGLILMDKDGHFKQRYLSKERAGAIANNWVSSFCYSQKQDLLWVGTKDGLSMLDFNKKRFKQYRLNERDGRLTDNVFFLFKDSKQQFWWWSFYGFFTHKDSEKPAKFVASNGDNFENDTINCGYEDEFNTLWFGSHNGLLKVKDRSCQRILIDTSGKENYNSVSDIVCRDSILWLITYGGVIKYNRFDDTYQPIPFPREFENHNRVKTSTGQFDEKGNLWIGDKDGYVISYNVINKRYGRYSTALSGGQNNVRYNAVLGVHIKDENNLWLATFGSGLLNFNRQSKKVSRVSSNELLNTNVYAIHKDKDGFYWLNTNSKIVRYHSDSTAILSYGRGDGSLCREFNEQSHHVSSDGTVLMGGFGGFVEFNPHRFHYNERIPAVEVSSYFVENDHDMIGGQVYYNLDFVEGDSLEIRTDHGSITFNSSVLNFQNPEKNMVAWKLEGYDAEWDTLMAYDSKSYTSLPEGKYTLRIKGCNNDQLWNNDGDSIYLVVKPTFWDSNVSKALFLILGVALAFLFYKVRTRYLKVQKAQLESLVSKRTVQLQQSNSDLEESKEEVLAQKRELERHRFYLEDLVKERTVDLQHAKERAIKADRLKTAFLANLSHEIRTPMNSIVGFSTLLASDLYEPSERKEFARMVQKSSDSLLVLINDIIDISRIETGQVQLVQNSFDLKEHCSTVFKSIAFNEVDEINYLLDLDDVNDGAVMYSDPERLKQILSNLISNALKFTKAGHVRLRVLNGANAITLMHNRKVEVVPRDFYFFTVEDTGIGIAPEHHENIFYPFRKVDDGPDLHGGIGLGLSIVKQLVEMLGGEIWIESQLNVGTKFSFYIPKDSRVESIKKANPS